MRITIQKTILPFFTSADFAYLPKMSKGNTFEFVSTAFNNLDLRNIFINKTKTVVEYWNFNVIVQSAQSNILCLHCSAEIFILLCFFLGSRANKPKREFLQKLVSCPVLNFFPGFPQFTYTFMFIVRRLWLCFLHQLSVCYMDRNSMYFWFCYMLKVSKCFFSILTNSLTSVPIFPEV